MDIKKIIEQDNQKVMDSKNIRKNGTVGSFV